MATSPYFSHQAERNEQRLFDDLVVETIQLAGVDVYYLPAIRDEIDPILGESVRTTFRDIMPIEAYMPSGGVPSGDGEIMAKFGYAQRDTIEVVISKTRFRNASAKARLGLERPREGDLIFIGDIDQPYASQVNQFYEITYLGFTDALWNFGQTTAFKVTLTSYVRSHEKFETGGILDPIMEDISEDMEAAVNTAVKDTKATLLSFDKDNPLSNV